MKMPVLIISVIFLSIFSPCVSAAAAIEENDISAKAAVVIEARSGQVIWKKSERTRLPMASTTKIMTTLLTIESGDPDSEFTVDPYAVNTEGSSMGLREGDLVSKHDLCIGMLLPSGNDAANCAAVCVGGSIPDFVKQMNARGAELGLTSTHFVTPSGLHDDNHYSTALDMARLTAYALDVPEFAAICSQKSISLEFGDPPYSRRLYNTNKLLDEYEGCIGVKTGFTDEAGRCLVSAAERNGVRLICVTLNAPDDWNDHKKLYDHCFSQCTRVEVRDRISYETAVAGGCSDIASVIPEHAPSYVSIRGHENSLTYEAVIPPLIYAPVSEGEKIGTLIVYDNCIETERIPLVSAEDIPRSSAEAPPESIVTKIRSFVKNLLFDR